MDFYKNWHPGKNESDFVRVGRITALVAMIIAVILAKPFLGGFDSAFQTIQKYTGFVAPGIVAVFLMGMFWKRTTSMAAIVMLLGSVVISLVFEFGLKSFPFVISIWIIFLLCIAAGVIVSLFTTSKDNEQPVILTDINFKTTMSFNISALVISVALILIYAIFW